MLPPNSNLCFAELLKVAVIINYPKENKLSAEQRQLGKPWTLLIHSTWDKLYEKTAKSLRIGLFRTDLSGRILDADDNFIQLLRFPNQKSLLHTGGAESGTAPAILDVYPAFEQWTWHAAVARVVRRFDGTQFG